MAIANVRTVSAKLVPKKNLFDYSSAVGNAIKNSNNGFNVSGNGTYTSSYLDISNIPPGTYTISCNFVQTNAISTVHISCRKFESPSPEYGNVTSTNISGSLVGTFTIPQGENGVRLYLYSNVTATTQNTSCNFNNVQIELGSTATAFEPYQLVNSNVKSTVKTAVRTLETKR